MSPRRHVPITFRRRLKIEHLLDAGMLPNDICLVATMLAQLRYESFPFEASALHGHIYFNAFGPTAGRGRSKASRNLVHLFGELYTRIHLHPSLSSLQFKLNPRVDDRDHTAEAPLLSILLIPHES